MDNVKFLDIKKKIEKMMANGPVLSLLTLLKAIIDKYIFIFVFLMVYITNPALLDNLLEGESIFKVVLCFILSFIAVLILIREYRIARAQSGLMLYYVLLILLLIRRGFGLDCEINTAAALGIALLSVILFEKREYYIVMPIICLICDFFSQGFLNEVLITTLTIMFLTKNPTEESDNKYKNIKVVFGISLICYLICIIKNYLKMKTKVIYSVLLWQWFNDYLTFGFGTRGLVATVRRLIMGNEFSQDKNFLFIIITQLLCVGIMIFTIIRVYKKYDKDIVMRLLIIALICSEPFRKIMDSFMMVYFDGILVCILIACISLLVNDKFMFAIPFLILVAMCIHHGFAIFLFPILFMIMLYKYLASDEDKRKRVLAVAVTSVIIVVGMFAYFHFFAHYNNKMNYNDACKVMSEYTGHKIPDNFENMTMEELLDEDGYFWVNIDYVMFDGKNTQYGIQQSLKRGLVNSAIIWIIMIPLVLLYGCNFRQFNEKNRFNRLVAKTAPFFILVLMAAYLEADYGRWNGFYMMSLLLGLLVPIIIDREKSWTCSFSNEQCEQICRWIIILMIFIPNMGIFAV